MKIETSHSAFSVKFLGLLVSDSRFLNFHNLSMSDEAIVNILMLLDGVPINTFSLDRVTLTGEGR